MLFLGLTTVFGQFLLDPRVIEFGLLLQFAANAFSYAFRHMKVSTIIVVSKTSDFFIPILLWAIFDKWVLQDFLFSVSTVLLCLPLLFKYKGERQFHYLSAVAVVFFLVFQGALTPWYMMDAASTKMLWLPFTAALIAWRLVFSIAMTPIFELWQTRIGLAHSQCHGACFACAVFSYFA